MRLRVVSISERELSGVCSVAERAGGCSDPAPGSAQKRGAMGTSTPGAWPPDSGPDRPPRRSHRRLNVALAIGTGAVVVGGVLWSMISPSDYTRSHDGCVAITMASS